LVADGDESTIGRPLVTDATVSAEVVTQTRGPKLISFKYRPKARSRVKKGHRQELTVLRIADITFGGKSAAKAAKKADDEAKTERTRVEEAAAAQAAKDAELAAKLAVGAEAEKKATKTEVKPKTATKAKAETTTAKSETASASKTATKSAAPKKTTAKAEADAPAARAAAPKKPRATKKDE
jgi:large subunit ribosomal protein L21